MRRIISITSTILTLILFAIPVPAQTDTTEDAEVLRRIAVKIEALGRTYPHLAKFSFEKHVSRVQGGSEQLSIRYSNGVQYVPNPRYIAGKKGPKSVPVYEESDGIELILNLLRKEETPPQRVVFPEAVIGNRVVELIVEGKDTRAIKEIRGKIRSIIKDDKANYDEDTQLLLVFKAYPPHEKKERNLYELAREIKGFVDSPRFPPTGVETDKGIRYGVFAAKRVRVLKTTDSRRSPRSERPGAYIMALDPIYTICTKSYTVHTTRAGKRKITYTDCESGEGYEIPLRKRSPLTVYEVEILTGDIFRQLWQEKVGSDTP